MRKRKNLLRHETYAKRRVNICSSDQYGLGPKRMDKFPAVFSQSAQHDDSRGPSRIWRQVREAFQLARRRVRITL